MSAAFVNFCAISLPLVLGVSVSFGAVNIDDTRFSIRGVSPSYISAVALLFSLYGGLMAKEIWDKRTALDSYVGTEISSLRSLLRISQAVDPLNQTNLKREIYEYVERVRKSEYETRVTDANFVEINPLQTLYNLVIQDGLIEDEAAKREFLHSLETLRATRINRLLTELDTISNDKLGILFLFGFLTQIAIALAHAGNTKAVVTTTMLFSLAFSGSIFTLMRFDDAYRTGNLLPKMPLSKVK